MEIMRDAEAAAIGTEMATGACEHGRQRHTDAEIHAELEKYDQEVTGWAQQAATRAYSAAWNAKEITMTTTNEHGRLVDYDTTEIIRAATAEEQQASQEAARRDGGAGVITVDGRRCYVED